MKIKAAVLREYFAPLSIEELEMAEPKAHEVQVKHLATGFCHSDLHHILKEIPLPLPVVIGHESCSRVEKVGPEVTGIKPGDIVIGCWLVPCGKCFQCLRGRPNICEGNMPYFGSGNLLDGTSRFTDKEGKRVGLGSFVAGFATHSILPESGAIKVPKHINLPPEQLCQLGCSVVTGWGTVVKIANAHEGTSIGIWGCGAIGLNAIRFAALRRCRPIVAIDLEESKREIAVEFGATHFINSSKADPVPVIKELTGGFGLEYAIEAIGDPGAQVQAWWSLRMGATLITPGITPADSTTRIPLTYGALQAKSIKGTLYGEARPSEDLPNLMELMADGTLKTGKLVTRTIKLEEIEEARKAMVAREIIGRWVIKYD
ncbi:MAG: alcohol dehydrogenase catalytic domain-containing protein [Dehalococcoidales bacterium]|nr:alcohol dehydrogenase catalytic domain-containing protein [Dehalococcoidales bacterium]